MATLKMKVERKIKRIPKMIHKIFFMMKYCEHENLEKE
jgi:hypothetical protein